MATQQQPPSHYIPNFSNLPHESASAHWLAFEDYVEETKVEEAHVVGKFRLTLSGEPRIWYSENKETFENKGTLEKLFKSTYGKAMTRSDYLKQFVSLSIKPNEDLGSYKNRVKSTAAKAKIKDNEQIMLQFIEGLPSHVRIALKAKRDTTLEDCLLTAKALMSETKPVTPQVFAAQASSTPHQSDLVDQMQSLLLSFQSRSPPSHHSHSHQSNSHHRRSPHPNHRDQRPSRHSNYYQNDRQRSLSRSSSAHRGRSPGDRSYPTQRFDRSNSRGRSSNQQRHFSRERSSDRFSAQRRDMSADRRSERRDRSNDRSVSFQNRRSGSPITCRYCSTPGHKWSECYKLEKALASGKNADSLFL